MASLPPKPLDPPSTQREERRHPVNDEDSHPARPMAQSRYRDQRLSTNDRRYVPRTQSSYDSYAPAYDRRREDDMRRRDPVNRERDRDRGVWERNGDTRERGSRFGQRSPEHDRDRRTYTRDREHDRNRGHYSPHDRHRDSYDRRDHRPSSPIRTDAHYRRSSRSPARRRAISPAPYRARSHSRPRTRSPPAKRLRLDHQSDHKSPRSSPPLRNAHTFPSTPSASETLPKHSHVQHNNPSTSVSLSQSPQETQECSSSNKLMDRPQGRGTLPHLSQSEHPTEVLPTQQHQSRAEPHQREDNGNAAVAPPTGSNIQDVTYRMDTDQIEPKRDEKDHKSDVDIAVRPLSPPKHPRFRDAQPPNILQRRRESRSPPRGPRNHPKNMAAPSASSSFPPTGLPRGPRSQYLHPTTLASQDSTPSTLLDEPPSPAVGSEPKATLPLIPTQKPRPSLTPELDIEIARLQTHRAHLASEYVQISKGTRRALHELDTATLDLRAAEGRRKVADIQMEKARAGVLGIDAGTVASMA